ncbi:MAG: hypothetical protein HPY50_04180 [Firmicutes bacterium]|nr:hypothetical protein [Bacillota bacterium]
MDKLFFNQETIKRLTGIDTTRCLLYPHMDLDCRVFSSPLMLEKEDGTSYLFVKDIERGNFREQGLKTKVTYFRPYLTFDQQTEKMPDDWFEVLRINSKDKKIVVDDSVCYSVYEALKKEFEVVVSEGVPWWRVYTYEVDPLDVLNEFMSTYDESLDDAKRIAPGLTSIMQKHKDSRFEKLQELLGNLQIKTLLVSSPLNQQEITGIPFQFFNDNSCLTVCCQNRVFLLTNQPLTQSFPKLVGGFPNLKTAYESLPIDFKSPIGIEENNLSYGQFRDLGLSEDLVCPATVALRVWREIRAGEELPFYIIAARTTCYGIETAIERTKDALKGAAILETDVERFLYSAFKDFEKTNQLSVQIQPYFLVLHAGNRTRRPNLPQFSPVNSDTRSLKIDCGVLVIDRNGLVRAASDLCRTLTLDDNARELYQFVDQQMTGAAIPSAVPGKTGEEVYHAGTQELIQKQDRWVSIGVLPPGVDLAKEYNRDIGHVMGKQEPATLGFRKGNTFVLKDGMIGCVEYQWPYYPYAIGVEDMFLVTSQGAVNITR